MNQQIEPRQFEAKRKWSPWKFGLASLISFCIGWGFFVGSKGPAASEWSGGCVSFLLALIMVLPTFFFGVTGVALDKKSYVSWLGLLLSVVLLIRVLK